uniref:SLC26A/SulP transporter domain-containing protein n=1 Tax=Plectus sambesii TaxID=2011161 RepID=A0A914X1T2_9BILA
MNQEEFDAKFCYKPPPDDRQKKQIKKAARKCYEPCTSFQSLWHYIASFLPILTWLPAYSWKNELVNDAIGGFTVGILLVPQGIAYAVLAGVEPVYGLYSSFFPALIYMFLGTSKHCSIGPFSVVSLMAGIAIREVLHPGENGSFDDASKLLNSTANETQSLDQLTPIEVATTLTLAIGLVQLLMAVLRLGFLTTYLSDQVVAGFTTAVAFHVLAAQLDDLLGIKIPHRNGFGYLFFEAYSILLALPSANIAAVVISTCSIVFLFVCKEFISPLFEKKIRVPIPSELLAVIFGTIISYYLQLNAKYKVEIVDFIPAGMPTPRVPQLDLIPSLLSNAVGIAIVIIAIHISLAKVFAKKHNYPIDAGQ